MSLSKIAGLFAALAAVGQVNGHGYVTSLIINGVSYPNYNPTTDWYQAEAQRPIRAGWTVEQIDLGFVEPNKYSTPDIICHRSAVPGKGHIRVAAGSTITLQWSDWPESHKGPVFDHLAACNGPCESVNKESLRFFKIDGAGLVSSPSTYAGDILMQNNDQWSVKIPANVAPGNYVLRHEILALHSASSPNGAQSYPQCFNLEVTGSGTATFPGTAGTALLSPSEAGVVFNIWSGASTYPVPGGPIVSGGTSMVPQSVVRASSTGIITPGAGGAAPTTRPPSPAPPTTTQAPVPAPPTGGGGTVPLYGQCGGVNWTGATKCAAGTCKALNDFYHQCAPN